MKGLDGRTLRQLLSRRSGETPGVSPKEPRRSEGLPAIRIASPARAAESPAVVGRSGGGLRPRDHQRHIEAMRPGAVGVRYDTPLSVHLRRNTWARTLSRESHSLHVEKNRKNIICYRLRASDMSLEEPHQTIRQSIDNCKAGRAHQISYTSVCTPVVGAGGRPRSLLPCAKFTGPRLVTSCNTPTVGSRAGRETTQIRGLVERSNRGANFSRSRVSRLT